MSKLVNAVGGERRWWGVMPILPAPVMGGIAKQFSNNELKVLADYMASLPGEMQTVQRSRVK